ncbi:hypothetical protein V2J09_002082 [Rumex salicifolius]
MASHNKLHLVFFPLMAQGHMIPLFDIARLFGSRGVKATLITTPCNAAAFPETDAVEIEILRFPSEEVDLPEGVENVTQLTEIEHSKKFTEALKLMAAGPLAELLQTRRPSCLVADVFIPETADVAAKVNIPWVAFHGGGYFAQAVSEVFLRERPQWGVESEDEEFVVPGLPGGEVRLTRRKLSSAWTDKDGKSEFAKMIETVFKTAAERSFGFIMNSFYELESDYADYYEKATGRRCWSLGPVSLCFRNMEDKTRRGKEANIDVGECLKWLDTKPEGSVIYVCFGSVPRLPSAQLTEIGMALEASSHHFIWVVNHPDKEEEEWLPTGFESRNEGKGLVIRGWAPQVMILDHRATGGFVTHCGWNSTLEGVSAGVPMVTWPMFAEQFINEKLITEVLRVGVSVGADQNCEWSVAEERVRRQGIEAAVRRVMAAEEMRKRAAELKELAWKAVQEGGSSYNELTRMLDAVKKNQAVERMRILVGMEVKDEESLAQEDSFMDEFNRNCSLSTKQEHGGQGNEGKTSKHRRARVLEVARHEASKLGHLRMLRLHSPQLTEIAIALEASDHHFIWVVRAPWRRRRRRMAADRVQGEEQGQRARH